MSSRGSDEREDWRITGVAAAMKRIGFLSFGHWTPSPHSRVRSASDALRQSIELAVAAEELGADGAYFRVHHFAPQLASPFPLLAAIGARTSRIELGTGVIDMRYENPLYMAEDAGAADLICGGRLRWASAADRRSRWSTASATSATSRRRALTDADIAREHPRVFLEVIEGAGFAEPNPQPMFANPQGLLRGSSRTPRAAGPDLVGRRHAPDRGVDGRAGAEPDELDAAHRGHRGALPPAPDRTDPAVPGRLEGRRAPSRAAGLGQPQHLPDRQRPGPGVLRRSGGQDQVGTWTAATPGSAGPTRASRTS